MGKKKFYTNYFTDSSTGEVQLIHSIGRKIEQSEMFSRIYHMDSWDLCKLSGAELKVIIGLLKWVDYKSNMISLDQQKRQILSEVTGLKAQSIRNALSSLVKAEYLFKQATNIYIISPKYSYFGEEKKRKELAILTKCTL